jgi:hypothetical protein
MAQIRTVAACVSVLVWSLAFAANTGCDRSPGALVSPAPPAPPAPLPPVTCSQQPATITFTGLSSTPEGSPVDTYAESGFTLRVTEGSWMLGKGYRPAPPPASAVEPYLYFNAAYGTSSSGGFRVSAGGCSFTLKSVVLYSSVTTIPYLFTGLKNGSVVFAVEETFPHTYGTFKTVLNSHSADVIDTLDVQLTNPATNVVCCGRNPVAIAHVVLNQ